MRGNYDKCAGKLCQYPLNKDINPILANIKTLI